MKSTAALIAFFFVSQSVYADQESPLTVSAVEIEYCDCHLLLDQEVCMQHGLGKMTALHAKIYAQNVKNFKPIQFGLLGNVCIVLKDSGQLLCESADFDINQLVGNFEGNVVYTETCRGKRQENIALIVKSDRMKGFLNKAGEKHSPKSFIQELDAEGNVSVNYNHDFIAGADKGLYSRRADSNEVNPSTGVVTLSMNDPMKKCKIVNRNGDLIHASQIAIDTQTKELVLEQTSGCIRGCREGQSLNQKIEFSSDNVLWNGNEDKITFRNNVLINQAGLGNLSTEGEVIVYQGIDQGKKRLERIVTTGKTVIVFQKPRKAVDHTLTSFGTVLVDLMELKTQLESPLNEKGKVDEVKQIRFQDPIGEIFADRAVLEYQESDGKVVLSRIALSGNVRLRDFEQDFEGKVLHYILADKVDYSPVSKEMVFSSKAKRRVLFYDRVNDVQISAPAIHAKRDEMTKKESIQGVGDVRFNFLDQEYAQLRKRFKLDVEAVSE